MSTAVPPRFERASVRGTEHGFEAPLPRSLAELPQVRERAKQHELVAGRLAELRAKRVELSRELAASEQADREQAQQAALTGKAAPRRQKSARLRGLLEEVEAEAAAFEDATAKSADAILQVASAHAAAALEHAVEGRQAALRRAREHDEAADAARAEAGVYFAEAAWLRRLAEGAARIAPFREMVADPPLQKLRQLIRMAILDWEHDEAERQARVEERRAWIAEEKAREERGREQALRDDRERRVVTQGMAIIEKGGRPVGPRGIPAEEQQP